ncbi:CotH kinase family protein [Hyalangium versicolor]|uniref:CotH kinase family protein n=1 Tax=Hyalangium versicolor TaxID=2861190 RepID=UPI002815FB20|nr:CotH kinase family protein [Hyalangium versicolor]
MRILGGALLLASCVVLVQCSASSSGGSEDGAEKPTVPLPPIPIPPFPMPGEPGDGGTSTPDAGTPDAGTPDAGTPDAGTPESPHATLCAPDAGARRWLLEGETVSVTLRCAKGLTGPDVRFTVSPLPAGATLDEATGTFRWTPGKDQAAVWTLTVTERSTGETGTLEVGVVDNWQAPGNVPIVDPAKYTEEYGLPVFHLSFEGQLTAGGYRPAELVYRGHHFTFEAKYRGATSSVFPKRSLTFKFPDDDLFNEPIQAGGSFQARKRVVLITSFNDNSYLRPRLAFDLWNRMSPDHIQIKTYSAVVYRNGSYWGIFTVAEHVDDDLMERHGLSKKGDLFKAVDADANFARVDADGAPKETLHQGFEKSEGKPPEGWPGDFDGLDALTTFVADSPGDGFRQGRDALMNARDYEDWWIFNTLIVGTDSSAKNAYHYQAREPSSPTRFIPWDLDASFGQGWDTRRRPFNEMLDFKSNNLIFARQLDDPAISGPMRERYQQLLHGPLSKAEVLQLIDGYVAEIDSAVRRDEARWGQQYRTFTRWADRTDFTTYSQEVDYLRQWVDQRWDLLEHRLP